MSLNVIHTKMEIYQELRDKFLYQPMDFRQHQEIQNYITHRFMSILYQNGLESLGEAVKLSLQLNPNKGEILVTPMNLFTGLLLEGLVVVTVGYDSIKGIQTQQFSYGDLGYTFVNNQFQIHNLKKMSEEQQFRDLYYGDFKHSQ